MKRKVTMVKAGGTNMFNTIQGCRRIHLSRYANDQ